MVNNLKIIFLNILSSLVVLLFCCVMWRVLCLLSNVRSKMICMGVYVSCFVLYIVSQLQRVHLGNLLCTLVSSLLLKLFSLIQLYIFRFCSFCVFFLLLPFVLVVIILFRWFFSLSLLIVFFLRLFFLSLMWFQIYVISIRKWIKMQFMSPIYIVHCKLLYYIYSVMAQDYGQ